MRDIDIDEVRRLDGRLLLVFRELLRTGSASTAAERLSLSQSAVSHALARLRTLHHDELFIRRPYHLEPTRRALELAPHIEAMVELAADLFGGGATFDPLVTERTFRIAAPEFVMATFGGMLLSRLCTAAPRASFVTCQPAPDEMLRAVRAGDIDLGIGRVARRAPPGVRRELLYRDEYCVVARRKHPAIRGAIDRRTYLDAGHVVASSASEAEQGESIPRVLRVQAVVPAWLNVLSIVAASDAVATCPRRLAEAHARVLRLQVFEVPEWQRTIEVSMVRRDLPGGGSPDVGTEWLASELRALVDTS
jgi:DNA-binding transcriptional LysR family regulator